jgi:hypothetical protein
MTMDLGQLLKAQLRAGNVIPLKKFDPPPPPPAQPSPVPLAASAHLDELQKLREIGRAMDVQLQKIGDLVDQVRGAIGERFAQIDDALERTSLRIDAVDMKIATKH